MKRLPVGPVAALVVLLVAGCASQKGPAEQAVAAASASLAAVRADAQKYAPEKLQAVDDQLRSLKDSFAKGDYRSVLTSAPTLNSSIRALKYAAEAKKADAEAALARAREAWGPMSTEVPKMVDAIQGRLAAIAKSHHLPRGVTREGLSAATSGVDSLRSMWSEAASASAAGDYTTAVARAQAAKDKAGEIMRSLGMPST
jgi:hypothetical protein